MRVSTLHHKHWPGEVTARGLSCCTIPKVIVTSRLHEYRPFSDAAGAPSSSTHQRLRKSRSRSKAGAARAARQPESNRWAKELVQQYVQPNSTVGLGTGILINSIIEHLAQQANAGLLKGVKCIPASDVSASEAAFQGLLVTNLNDDPRVDVVFEEVDEIALQQPGLPFVAGRFAEPVQPQLLRMRILLAASQCNVVLVNGLEQTGSKLRGVLPVVVDADVWEDVGEALDDTFIPDAEIWRRSTAGYDPTDPRAAINPYTSADGHNILDVKFYGPLKLYGEDAEYAEIAAAIEAQTGVITHGLFVGVATAAAVVTVEGVDIFEPAVAIQ